jgi:hypothetical protein
MKPTKAKNRYAFFVGFLPIVNALYQLWRGLVLDHTDSDTRTPPRQCEELSANQGLSDQVLEPVYRLSLMGATAKAESAAHQRRPGSAAPWGRRGRWAVPGCLNSRVNRPR